MKLKKKVKYQPGKTEPMKRHALKRLKERFDPDWTSSDLVQIKVHIERNWLLTHVSHTSNRVSVHEVQYKEKNLRVVYDNKRRLVVTVTPLRPVYSKR